MSVPADKTEILAACRRAIEQRVAIILLPRDDFRMLLGMLDPETPAEQRMSDSLQEMYAAMYDDDSPERWVKRDRSFRFDESNGVPPNDVKPRDAYVYAYFVLGEPAPFYVGYSSGGKSRAMDVDRHSPAVQRMWQKHECKIEIIADELSPKQARIVEKAIIKAFRPLLLNKSS